MLTPSAETELADPKNWSVDEEVHLLYGTLDNKPVGTLLF